MYIKECTLLLQVNFAGELLLMRKKIQLWQLLRGLILIVFFSLSIEVLTNPKQTLTGFLGPDREICFGDTLTLEAPLAFSYLWSTGQTSRFIQVTPSSSLDYWVTITNLQGQTERDTVGVIVKPLPNIVVSPTTTNLLPGEAVLLTASGGNSYLWSNGVQDNKIFVEPSLPVNNYWVEGTASNGCKKRAEAVVFVEYTTHTGFVFSKACLGDTTFFEANIQTNDTIISVEWDLDGDLMFDDASGNETSYVYDTPGERLAGIKVMTKHSATAHIGYYPVKVGTQAFVDFSYSGACRNTDIAFEDLSFTETGQIVAWNWDFGNGETSDKQNPTTSYNQNGLFTSTLEVQTDFGCVSSLSRNINVLNPPQVNLAFQDGSPFNPSLTYSMYRNDTLKLMVSGIYDSVLWNNQIWNTKINITRGGMQSVSVFRQGCSNTLTFMVDKSELAYDPDFKIQNILTPNGDGYNDTWEISILNSIRPAKVTVYTRAGLTVFESTNYQNNWAGTYNSNPLPEGSYFYVIEGNGDVVIKGTITLIR